jgi:hypothetical protein
VFTHGAFNYGQEHSHTIKKNDYWGPNLFEWKGELKPKENKRIKYWEQICIRLGDREQSLIVVYYQQQ